MPRVPMLNRPQVRSTPLPGVEAPLSAFTGPAPALGQAAQGLGQVADVVERERVRALNVKLNAAEVKARDLRTRILHNPKDGILNRQGEQAFDVQREADEAWASGLSSIAAEITDPRAQEAFRLRMDGLRSEMRAQTARHESGERERVDAASATALIEDLLTQIANLPGDVQAVDDNLLRAEAVMQGRLDRQGTGPETKARELARLRSNARLTQIQALVTNKQYSTAAEIATAVRDELSAAPGQNGISDRERVRRLVEDGMVQRQAQEAEDEIFAKHPNSEREALAEARTYEGPLRDEVVRRVEARFADERRLFQQSVTDHVTRAMGAVERGEAIPSADREWLLVNAPDKLNALRMRQRQVQNGVAPVTDWDKFEEVMSLSAAELRALNPSDYRPYLSDPDYRTLLNTIATLNNTGGRGQRDALTPTQRTNELLTSARQMGLVPERVTRLGDLSKLPKAKADFGALNDAVTLAIEEAATEKGSPLTGPEQRDVMQRVLDDQVMATTLFGGDIKAMPRAFARDRRSRELTPAERQQLPQAPAGVDPDEWEQYLRETGQMP